MATCGRGLKPSVVGSGSWCHHKLNTCRSRRPCRTRTIISQHFARYGKCTATTRTPKAGIIVTLKTNNVPVTSAPRSSLTSPSVFTQTATVWAYGTHKLVLVRTWYRQPKNVCSTRVVEKVQPASQRNRRALCANIWQFKVHLPFEMLHHTSATAKSIRLAHHHGRSTVCAGSLQHEDPSHRTRFLVKMHERNMLAADEH